MQNNYICVNGHSNKHTGIYYLTLQSSSALVNDLAARCLGLTNLISSWSMQLLPAKF